MTFTAPSLFLFLPLSFSLPPSHLEHGGDEVPLEMALLVAQHIHMHKVHVHWSDADEIVHHRTTPVKPIGACVHI